MSKLYVLLFEINSFKVSLTSLRELKILKDDMPVV